MNGRLEGTMLKPGLLSVTFRKLSPEEIVQLIVQAGLKAIEWGGDIHVPPGDMKRAERIGSSTRDAGIEVASYGSYYRVGCKQTGLFEFEQVLETALALQAPAIRVWAGNRGSKFADEQWRSNVIEDARRIADMAYETKVSIDFEFHDGTLTDTADSALRLIDDIKRPNIRSYWQPQINTTREERMYSLQSMIPNLANLHVFHWVQGKYCPLMDGEEEWVQYISEVLKTGRTHFALLEFVKDDDPNQFLKDAQILKNIIWQG